MDINDWRGVATATALIAFIGVCLWAYSGRQKEKFDNAAQSPFADEPNDK
ncbi:cytochrome c oxidase cbb3-type subunit 4 [Sinobacterium caligoides]|uniref:Cytochrome c oxidase cbb3-type subunit 4 n=1 Tax=Sinobacterium caligoides TaxID=933926 RepID=A0A3N2E111_9GAMM|nr:cbb3-type cytochrome c oxidase subunit 3 [Sinobacterium caligoides]ROS05265.1 cytochrome c oxidase cbb3-type subunit 4 [Sinobacterium caligoides]